MEVENVENEHTRVFTQIHTSNGSTYRYSAEHFQWLHSYVHGHTKEVNKNR
jgi:hypothetical protein